MKIIAANWKLNKSPKEAEEFLKNFKAKFQPSPDKKVLVFPSAVALQSTAVLLQGTSIGFGFQNVAIQNSGAFTGENSAAVGLELGAKYALVGHSERRSLFSETSESINQKLLLLQKLGVTPVYCIGETLKDRDANKTNEILKTQIESELVGVTQGAKLIVAYEPVWAIGTGRVASLEQIAEAHAFIHKLCSESMILYGGSVKPDNSKEILNVKHVDGLLIGGASLEVDSLIKICESASL